jgi:hypothetical protein
MKRTLMFILLVLGISSCSLFDSSNTANPTTAKTNVVVPLTSGVQTVSGIVLDGGDQTPEGLLDSPRKFIYKVRISSGEEIKITYTAFPPSPATDDQPGPQLKFHSGTINVGDHIKARGTYDSTSKTLTIAEENDFIETTPN